MLGPMGFAWVLTTTSDQNQLKSCWMRTTRIFWSEGDKLLKICVRNYDSSSQYTENWILSWNKWLSIEIAEAQEECLEKVEGVHHVEDEDVVWKLGKHNSSFTELVFDDHVSGRVGDILLLEIQNQLSICPFFCHPCCKATDPLVLTILIGGLQITKAVSLHDILLRL